MSSLFGSSAPKAPAAPAPLPPVPTVDDAANSSEAEDKLRRRKGRASTVLTQTQGELVAPATASSALLGS